MNDVIPSLLQPLENGPFPNAAPAADGERTGEGSFETKASRFRSGRLVLTISRVSHERVIQVEKRGCLLASQKMGQLIIGGLDSRS
jgi:hypothetical protein